MVSNRLAFAVLSITSVVAAAGGGYLATRQNAAEPSASSIVGAPDSSLAGVPAVPVEETEALIEETSATKDISASKPAAEQREALPRRTPERPAASNRTTTPSVTESARPATPTARTSAGIQAPSPAPVVESPSSAAPHAEVTSAAPRDEDTRIAEVPRAPEPPARTFEELVVSADSVIGLQMESALSSERARVEDRVEARVVRDVQVGGAVAIPAGSRAIGSVMVVERGGRLKERARLGIRFHTLVLADGTRLPITSETVYRNGEAPGNASAAKIGGGAAAGAILGAIIGGAKGAAIGGTVGAGAGTASVMTSDRNAATFPAGTEVTARILSPVTVTIEK